MVDGNMWNSIISHLPNPHFLQTFEWGQVKAKYGWTPIYAVWFADGSFTITSQPADIHITTPIAACLILKRAIPIRGFTARFSVLYAPKGPLLDWSNDLLRTRVLSDMQSFAKKQGAIFLKIDPDVILGTGTPGADDAVEESGGVVVQSELTRRVWIYSSNQVQFRNTVLIDLEPSEEDMLARMKQKTRYNIRLAEKKGVSVREGTAEDFPMLYKMYAETSMRDGFVIRDQDYYRTVWTTFLKPSIVHGAPSVIPLVAEVNNEPVAGLFLFIFGERAYYVYDPPREDAHLSIAIGSHEACQSRGMQGL
jgi:peptidoglycan pentaglycine glycine transferase (the first glycine)